jgi:hypothetical protein
MSNAKVINMVCQVPEMRQLRAAHLQLCWMETGGGELQA